MDEFQGKSTITADFVCMRGSTDSLDHRKESWMFRMKACSRCVGDVFQEITPDGPEWVCIQCGNRIVAVPVAIASHPGSGPLALSPAGRPTLVATRTWASRFDHAADADLGHGIERPQAA